MDEKLTTVGNSEAANAVTETMNTNDIWNNGFKKGFTIGIMPFIGYLTYKKVIKPGVKMVKTVLKKADGMGKCDGIAEGDYTEGYYTEVDE